MAKYDLVWPIWLNKRLSIAYHGIGFSRLNKKFAARLLDSQPPLVEATKNIFYSIIANRKGKFASICYNQWLILTGMNYYDNTLWENMRNLDVSCSTHLNSFFLLCGNWIILDVSFNDSFADRSFCVLVISVISSVCSLIYLERPHICLLYTSPSPRDA